MYLQVSVTTRVMGCLWNVELLKLEHHPLQVLLVLHAVDEVSEKNVKKPLIPKLELGTIFSQIASHIYGFRLFLFEQDLNRTMNANIFCKSCHTIIHIECLSFDSIS